jgi:hypothetical protein
MTLFYVQWRWTETIHSFGFRFAKDAKEFARTLKKQGATVWQDF